MIFLIVSGGNRLGNGLLGIIHRMSDEVHECSGIEHIRIHCNDARAFVGEDTGLVEYGDIGIRHAFKILCAVEHNSLLGAVTQTDDTGERDGDDNGHRRRDQDDHQRAVNRHDIAIISKYRQCDSVCQCKKHRDFKHRAGTAEHDLMDIQRRGVLVLKRSLDLCGDFFVLICQQFKRGLLGVILCIIEQKLANLIKQDDCRALYCKADKESDDRHNDNYDRGGKVPAVLNIRDGFHDDVIARGCCGKNEQNYADKIRHTYDKRNGKDHRGQYKSDDQSISECVERTERTDSL